MLAAVFTSTFATLAERWRSILAATVASGLLTILLAFLLLVPALKGLMPQVQPAPAGGAEVAMSTDPVTGVPVVDPSVAELGAKATVEGPGAGDLVLVLVAFGAVMAVSIATATTGVFAAAGLPWQEALVQGARTSPQAIVQTFLIGWKLVACYAVAFAAPVLFGTPAVLVSVVAILAALWFALRAVGAMYVAIGSIAHGHVSWTPEVAREAVAGREWSASGIGLAGMVVSAVANVIPFLGAIFVSAFTSAMWQEFGDGAGPAGDAPAAPETGGTATTVAAAEATPEPTPAGPADATTQATGQLVAGPGWNAMATPSEPTGQWLQLARSAAVAVQVQWTTGVAPAVHHADQAGQWTAAATQPAASGESTWLQLDAGWHWLAIIPREAEQQLWVQAWLPEDAVAPAATAAA